MTNDELKKKILSIVRGAMLEADELPFIETTDNIADALIAAGIGDVKDLQAQVDVLEITNIALQAGYDDAEKDRLYWVDKYKEAEHRAEVAERALGNLAYKIAVVKFGDMSTVAMEKVKNAALEQAEKELAEEEKE